MYKLDWLAFTVSNEIDVFEEENSFIDFRVLNDLGYKLDEFEEVPGKYFYNSGLSLGNYVNVYYNDNEKIKHANSSSTRNYVWTGQGCIDLYERVQGDLLKVFQLLKSVKANVTRIDLALDDFEGVLDFKKIVTKLEKSEYRSSKKSYNIVKSADVTGKILGETIYIGNPRNTSSKGGYYCRMYDKLAQYVSKNQIPPDDVEIWQRYEISYSKKKAAAVSEMLINGFGVDYVFKTTMRDIIEFLDKKKDKNKSRWPVCKWWNDFLEIDDKISFDNHERDVMLADLLAWLQVAVIPNIKLLEIIGERRGFDIYKLLQTIDYTKEFSKKQNRLFNNAMSLSDDELNKYLMTFANQEFKQAKAKITTKGNKKK